MRVVIDALSVIASEVGGGETYIAGLVDHLGKVDPRHQYTVLTTRLGRHSFSTTAENVHFKIMSLDNRSRFRRVVYEQTRLPDEIRQCGGADVVHFPGNMVSGKVAARFPTVVTIHDVSPNFYLRSFPAHTSRLRAFVLLRFLDYAARRSTVVVTDSQFSRREICEYSGIAETRVHVIPLGLAPMVAVENDTISVLRRYGIAPPYVLSIGTTNKHKNLDALVRAFANARRSSGFRHHLVIGGREGSGHTDLQHAVSTTQASEFVHLIGYVDSAHLPTLYQAADAFAMPSLYEGFGFPALEAMHLGVPVILSVGTSLTEVGGDACVYVNPRSEQSITEALVKILTDSALREQLSERGKKQAGRFSWKQTAQEMVRVYELAAST